MRALGGIGLFSAAVLLFQVALTRLFSIAQFYHFAFLVVSLALLGFGISGSLLAVWPRLRRETFRSGYALGFATTTVIAYLIVNHWPFDSYAIAWDRAQVWRLLANLLCLAVPFTLAGLLTGAYLTESDLPAGRIYGANLIGSAAGAGTAPLLLAWLGGERSVVFCGLAAGLAAFLFPAGAALSGRLMRALAGLILVIGTLGLLWPPGLLEIRPSPYKALSYFRQNPDARLETPRDNSYARLDIVHSPTIHSAPGLSMTYLSAPPPEIGLLIDGDSLLPAVQADAAPPEFAAAMPAALPLSLYTDPAVLVLGAGGGLDVWTALNNGARSVVAVEPNRLVYDALRRDLRTWTRLADDPRVTLIHQDIRTYAQQQSRRTFDVVQLGLTDAYRPVTSGAFTLTENYVLTVEAFRAYLDLLNSRGLFVVTRWLQNPPSEDLRVLGLIVAALKARGGDPAGQIVAFRSFQTVTFLVKATPFTSGEIEQILAGAERLKYDMVLAPNLPPETINRFARLPEPIYHNTYTALLTSADRDTFYADYDFEVRPPTDDHPFFFHFFKWSQTPQILNNLGRTWQPFGGSGYFVLVALLIFATAAALIFVVIPVGIRHDFRKALRAAGLGRSAQTLAYFGGLGLAFLLIEMAVVQQFVLILGQPTLAIAFVLATLLFFSGIGSLLSDWLPWRASLGVLIALVWAWPWIMTRWGPVLLGLPLELRLMLGILTLAPLAFLMGVPFARGLAAIRPAPGLVPWAWAVNGGMSVVSAILAPLLALSLGFIWVLWLGGAWYTVAWLSRPLPSRA